RFPTRPAVIVKWSSDAARSLSGDTRESGAKRRPGISAAYLYRIVVRPKESREGKAEEEVGRARNKCWPEDSACEPLDGNDGEHRQLPEDAHHDDSGIAVDIEPNEEIAHAEGEA